MGFAVQKAITVKGREREFVLMSSRCALGIFDSLGQRFPCGKELGVSLGATPLEEIGDPTLGTRRLLPEGNNRDRVPVEDVGIRNHRGAQEHLKSQEQRLI